MCGLIKTLLVLRFPMPFLLPSSHNNVTAAAANRQTRERSSSNLHFLLTKPLQRLCLISIIALEGGDIRKKQSALRALCHTSV